MPTQIDQIEQDLLRQSASAQLYAFTRTVNTLPRDQVPKLNRKILKQVAENIRSMPASNDAKIAVMNIYASKFGH
jgi:hypothetical protein